jgi:hypothetical protein
MAARERHQPVTPGQGQKSVPFQSPAQEVAGAKSLSGVQRRAREANEKA